MASYFDHFMVTKVLNLYITDSFFMMIFALIVNFMVFYNSNLMPSNLQMILEKMFTHWETVVKENLGDNYKYFQFPLFSLFMFILSINLLSFFLFTFPPTTHLSVTFGLAFSFWLGVVIMGFMKFNSNYFSIFMPTGAPMMMAPLLVGMELASYMSSPMALGMRLAANLTAGHILLAILGDFGMKMLYVSWSLMNLFPILMILFMVILEVGVLVIQAYVFTLLLMIYLKDSLILH